MTGLTTTEPQRGLALHSFDDAFRFAGMVAKSDFAPKDFRGKPEACLLAIQHGAELGLSPLQSLQSITVINGRPSIYGDAAKACCLASAICEYIRETVTGDGEQMVATCVAKRRGNAEPTTVSFSAADAKKAGLWGKSGPWTQYPKRMLQMRARGFALRDAFADVLRGLVTAEEAQDYTHHEEVDAKLERQRELARVRKRRQRERANGETQEAQDYTNHETPVVSQPAALTAKPEPKPPTADEAAMAKARAAITTADTPEDLRRFALAVHARQDDGFYDAEQAAELLDMLDERADALAPAEEVTA